MLPQITRNESMNLLQEGGETMFPTDTLSNIMDGHLNTIYMFLDYTHSRVPLLVSRWSTLGAFCSDGTLCANACKHCRCVLLPSKLVDKRGQLMRGVCLYCGCKGAARPLSVSLAKVSSESSDPEVERLMVKIQFRVGVFLGEPSGAAAEG